MAPLVDLLIHRLQLQRERDRQFVNIDKFRAQSVQELAALDEGIKQAKQDREDLSEKVCLLFFLQERMITRGENYLSFFGLFSRIHFCW